jgi:hypothetical protein
MILIYDGRRSALTIYDLLQKCLFFNEIGTFSFLVSEKPRRLHNAMQQYTKFLQQCTKFLGQCTKSSKMYPPNFVLLISRG